MPDIFRHIKKVADIPDFFLTHGNILEIDYIPDRVDTLLSNSKLNIALVQSKNGFCSYSVRIKRKTLRLNPLKQSSMDFYQIYK